MKKTILIFIFLSSTLIVYSQDYFQKIIGSPLNSEYGIQAYETSDSNFIIIGRKNIPNSFLGNPYLLKIDRKGNIITDYFTHDSSAYFSYFQILQFNSKILLYGILANTSNYKDSLVFTEIDDSLNVLYTRKIYIADSLGGGIVYISNIGDSLLLIGGYNDSVSPSAKINSMALLLDTNYTIVKSNFFINIPGCLDSKLNNLLNLSGDSLFRGLINGTPGSKTCQIDVNENLEVDSIYPNKNLPIKFPIYLHQKDSFIYILARNRINSATKQLVCFKLSQQFDTICSMFFGENNDYYYQAATRCISSESKYVYIGATKDINPADPWWGQQNSSFYLVKLNENDSVVWERNIGNDAYYILYDVLATSDGGCLLTGNRYDWPTNSYQMDIFVAKLDSNGQTSWIRNIELPTIEIKLFPNPTSDFINIELLSPNKLIESIKVLNLNGQIVYSQNANAAKTQINVSKLASGIYIIEGSTKMGLYFREKFVKD
ncbi:MAG: T9SS type A sorting domain-containing protein [Saprospiraceae bacterium]|nr:T9SS type A sorting domain-containing protein [Saprospiraceae bacterium]